jgi:acyl-lipid omega-6 desaturase (Delta-12 desaturase)
LTLQATAATPDWKKIVQPYCVPSTRQSVTQVVVTLGLLVVCEVAANLLLQRAPVGAVAFILVAAGLLVRAFILQHDCGHGSFLKNRRAADAIGTFLGVLMFTPYEAWRRDHAIHHATTGDLDRRGTGDIMTLTIDEYEALSPFAKLGYRAFRNPFVLFCLGPTMLFMFAQRFPRMFGKQLDPRVRRSVHLTNVLGAGVFAAIYLVGGWQALLLVHVPAAIVACSSGVFLFYVQHQFEKPSWRRHEDWNFAEASLDGSSYLKLPRVLRWFSGDIGVHHIHHLAPLVPNYALQRCMDENPTLKAATTFGIKDALKTVSLKLYDEQTGTLVGFKDARAIVAARRDEIAAAADLRQAA